ncbi:MAG: PD-(D/E)XK nuclease family protein [Actinomycetota bacterium]|nr:PD-(D/E)XK nuclease family protein [Actinomycetota bacterium]
MVDYTVPERINRLTEGLGDLCAERVLAEKWLLAPSLRAGFQWLDAVTRAGRPVVNARVKTLPGMALELAAPEMERRGLSLVGGMRAELLTDGILARMREEGGYLARLEASAGLVRAAASTLRELRLCGIAAQDLSPRLFDVPAKGRELASLLAAYEKELDSRDLIDLAGALRLAMSRLREDASALPADCLVAIAEDMLERLRGLGRLLWESVPRQRRVVLPVDRPGEERGGGAALLAWIARPGEAPSPRGGGVEMFRAVGEANEVREVLRRCVAEGIPFDEVEVLHTDGATYVPLIYELSSMLAPEPGGAVPATFAEGIPVRYSRPGRALAAWLSWIEEGFPQATLVRMVQEGLLDFGAAMPEDCSFSRLGSVLRSIPIGKGRERYAAGIAAELDSLAWRRANPDRAENGDDEEERLARLERRTEMVGSLGVLARGLLDGVPDPSREGHDLLLSADGFLVGGARAVSEFDEYSRLRLLDEIRELSSCMRDDAVSRSFSDIHAWLVELARATRVEGKGPRPGCLYVAPLAGGGHSGRPHTFIVGLDDGRFPGSGLQDPLLLDSERGGISGELSTAAERLAASLEDFARLAARLRSTVTLSYPCRSLTDDRDMFPSPVMLAAYRIVSGDRDAVQEDLLAWLPDPVSFSPRDPALALDGSEWWLGRLCGEPAVQDPEGAVAAAFPHLGRGMEARRARESDLFTAYDGYVPEAGADLDPALPGGPVLSASRLETLGRCPLEYFLAYVLGVKPPEEFILDPTRWLEPTEKGSLLHAVFHAFFLRLHEEGRPPRLERDRGALEATLADEINAWTLRKPPPNREVQARESEELRRAARIFLQEEVEHCRGRRPLFFEVAVGMEKDGRGNAVDSPQPVEIELPGGKTIRTRGYIDRVDEVGEPGSLLFSVCDYKTGSSYGYKREDPFRQGRRIQNFIYMMQAKSCLSRQYGSAEVESFQYFFPSTREHGERIAWDADTLAQGIHVLDRLYRMLSGGCFPFSDDKEDVSISDYRYALGDVDAAAEAMRRKLSNPENRALAPLRELRGYAEGGDG